MGSLGGLIASRIARELGIGGPSFTVSCDETSGIQALAIAADWLIRGELDAAIVGAVDFAGDIRGVLARNPFVNRPSQNGAQAGFPGWDEVGGFACCCDGAISLVLKRLDDAERDGDRIYAVIQMPAQGGGKKSWLFRRTRACAAWSGTSTSRVGDAFRLLKAVVRMSCGRKDCLNWTQHRARRAPSDRSWTTWAGWERRPAWQESPRRRSAWNSRSFQECAKEPDGRGRFSLHPVRCSFPKGRNSG